MKLGRLGPGILLSLILALAPGRGWALTDEEIFRDFRFNFTNPGARSLGLGGAFIAAADDATAAQANPAALHYVTKDEFFLEYRQVSPETQLFAPSQAIGSLSNPNPLFLELQAVTGREDRTLPSFASFAYPFRIGPRRATLAFSRQVVLDVENSLEDEEFGSTRLRFADSSFPLWVNPGGEVLSCSPAAGLEQYTICNDVDGSLSTELVHYNLGLSYSFVSDFSVGLTATLATLDMTSQVTNTIEDPRGALFSTHPRVDTGSGLLSDIQTRTSINDTDSAFTYTVGLHWHPDTAFPGGYSPIRFGLVYRKGAELEVRETQTEFDPVLGQFVLDPSVPPFQNTLREPDRVGVGMSYELKQRWTFALDAEQIEYSDLLENYRSGVNFFTSGDIASGSLSLSFSGLKFDVDDATVVHAGVEYFSRTRAGWGYAVRGGYYNAPDNRIRLTEITVTSSDPTVDTTAIESSFKDVFRGGDDVNHVTAGVSLNTPAGLQVQFAGDFADTGDEFLVSAIYRFGKVR